MDRQVAVTNNAVAVREDRAIAAPHGFTREQVELIKRTVAKDATDDELQMFLTRCDRMGLDPFTGQIYFIKRKGKGTIQVGIDGYRLTADRTGKYAGNDDPIFDGGEEDGHPRMAHVTVWKLVGGVRCSFTATARWKEYLPGEEQGFMWRRMPHVMLGKCAEALALRKAFPAELSGTYVDAEMDQADTPPPSQPQPEPARPPQVLGPVRPHYEPPRPAVQPAESVGPNQQYLANRDLLEEAPTLDDLSGEYKRVMEDYRQGKMTEQAYRSLYDVKEARKLQLLPPFNVDPTTGEMSGSEAVAEGFVEKEF